MDGDFAEWKFFGETTHPNDGVIVRHSWQSSVIEFFSLYG
jgi:hypothetical protein